jgi:toxin-antitoxin system PIN domain toxin
VDTNLLVYAHRHDVSWHAAAVEVIRGLAEGVQAWAIPWPCVHEFVAIVTDPRIFDPPSTAAVALDQVAIWLESPGLTLLAESPGYETHFDRLVRYGEATGSRVHDARVAALCLHHGVSELLTADRDYSRFPQLPTRNPLIDS